MAGNRRPEAATVLHVITGLGAGGAETMLCKLLQGLDPERFRSVVVSLMPRGVRAETIEALGVPVHALGVRPAAPSPLALWRLRTIVARLRPDLVQGWMYHGNLAASAAAWLAGASSPVLWNVRSSLYRLSNEKPATRLVIRLSARVSRRTAAILYCARISREQHQAFGFRSARQLVIPNGFDLDRFRPDPQARAEVRRDLGVTADAPLIGLIGRYHPMKDHESFLQAAGLLARTHPGVRFVLAGTGVDPANRALAAAAAAAGAAGRLHLLGERSDVDRILAALDVGCSSSWSEAFPNAVGEAMACGLPTVVTDVGDSAWIVGDTGLVVPPRDPEALSAGWAKLLALAPEERARLGEQARRRVAEEFSLTSVVEQYARIYDELLRGPGAAPGTKTRE